MDPPGDDPYYGEETRSTCLIDFFYTLLQLPDLADDEKSSRAIVSIAPVVDTHPIQIITFNYSIPPAHQHAVRVFAAC